MVQKSHRVQLTDDDIAALARVTGLPIERERLSRIRDEMEVALSDDRDMDAAVRRTQARGGEPFDPAWHASRKGESR